MIAQVQPTQLEKWRAFAYRFPAVEAIVIDKRLSADFEPYQLATLIEKGPITRSQRGVLRFLLHTWNLENPFELGETACWDPAHLKAMADWLTGKATGEPGHYF